jgi:hypothetical protein
MALSTPITCKQFLRTTPPGEKSVIYLDPCKETSKGAVHGSREISSLLCKSNYTLITIFVISAPWVWNIISLDLLQIQME